MYRCINIYCKSECILYIPALSKEFANWFLHPAGAKTNHPKLSVLEKDFFKRWHNNLDANLQLLKTYHGVLQRTIFICEWFYLQILHLLSKFQEIVFVDVILGGFCDLKHTLNYAMDQLATN